MPSATSVFQASLLPLAAVSLGRLTLNVKAPHESYLDPPTETPPETLKNAQHNYSELRTASTAFKLRGRLTQLLSASYEHRSAKQVDLAATRAYTYALCNSAAFFKAACACHGVRRWLQDAIEDGEDVYLVVGYHTVVDACFGTGRTRTVADRQMVSAPVDVTGFPAVGGMDMTAGVDTDRQFSRSFTRQFEAPGEQVYAVQFRKVVFRWFSSRKIDKGTLGENQWMVYAGRGDEDQEDDIVEASLAGTEDEVVSSEDGSEGDEEDELGETWTGEDGESVWVL